MARGGAFSNIVNSYGLKSSGVNALDVVSGVPVRIWNSNGTAVASIFMSSKSSADAACNVLKNAASAAGIPKPRTNGTSLSFSFGNSFKAVAQYQEFRNIISTNRSYFTLDQCPYCNMGNCDCAGLYKSTTAIKMHKACYERDKASQLTKLDSFDGNIVSGIIAALVAAIALIAITACIRYYAEYIIFLLYLGIPLMIGGAFRFGKGPYGKVGTICHFTISVFAVFGYFYLLACMLAADYYRVSVFTALAYFGEIMEILKENVISNCVEEIVLFAVGLILVLVMNPTSKKLAAKSIQANDGLLTPIASINPGFETYNPFGNTDSYNTSYNDVYGNQSTDAFGNTAGTAANNDYVDVYGNSSSNDNNGFGN